MLKVLTSLLILLNPAVAFFTPSHLAATPPATPPDDLALANLEDYKLPLSESMFLASQLIPAYPIRNWNIPDPEVSAKIAFVFEATRQRILWQKDGLHEARPIASLTKLMTALVTIENAKLDDVFIVSKKAVQTSGELGGLIVGEQLTVENLLYALLVESSNDAAVALAEGISEKITINNTGTDNLNPSDNFTNARGSEPSRSTDPNTALFVDLMNQKAVLLGLNDTTFTDPSGLDSGNRSSAWDLYLLMQDFLKYPVFRQITQSASFDFKSADGKFNHHLTSTDKLLGLYPEIIAGKTGYTEEAGNCLILAFRTPNNQGTVISIIMDSQDRLAESAELLRWTKEAFLW